MTETTTIATTDTDAEPAWNLYLANESASVYRIIMPNPDGSFDNIPLPSDGYRVEWLVNPHSTGEPGIARILNSTKKFAAIKFVY